MTPRGIRNNNPFNIRHSKALWKGEAVNQDDPAFVQFSAPKWGLRAGMKVLLTYQNKHGLNTIEKMISRFAPPSENDTEAYIEHVCTLSGLDRNSPVNLHAPENLIALAQAIVRHENGKCDNIETPRWYPMDTYEESAAMLLPKMERKIS